jgi:hypothetical protein
MAAKIKLDLDASDNLDFDREIKIPDPKGQKKPISITFKMKWRDRLAVAELFDEYIAKAREAAEAAMADSESDERKTMRALAADALKRDIETTLDICVGWNLENYEFNEDSLRKLFTKYPGAARQIADDYRVSLTEGRLGN